eukprot:3404163-Amphidinium_carterae.2
MVQRLHEFCQVHPEALHVIIGDLNFISDSADMIERSTGRALGQVGARHHTWHRYFANWTEVVLGFTHIHASGKHMSAIDRCFMNLPCPMVAMLSPRPIVIGLPDKVPGGSDHYPISVKFGSNGGVSDSQLPKWVAHHSSWGVVVSRWCEQLLDPVAPWQVRLSQVQDAIESAAAESLRLRHDRVALEAIERRCPSLTWLNPTRCVTTGRDAVQQLEAAWTHMLEAKLSLCQQSDDSSSHSREQWVSLCLARWKKSQVISEPAVASCLDPEMEVVALRRYWQEVFNRQADTDVVAAEHILPHTPMLPWDSLDLSRAQFITFIGKAPRTAAGPDGVTYNMLRPLANPLGTIFEDMMAGMALGQSLPVYFSDSLTVFVAKKQNAVLLPSDFRPLSLNSVWSKIPAAVLARQLSSLSDWVVSGAVSGLTLNWRKTKVLPLGFAPLEPFMERFRASTTSGWDEVSVVASLRFLGYMVGRGDVEMDSLAATKILARAQAIPDLKLGTAANAFLGNWHYAVNKLVPGGTLWLGDALFRVKEILGWPSQLQHIDINSTVAKLRTFLRKAPQVFSGRDVVALADARSTEPSPLKSWRAQGCLTSLVGVSALSLQLGLVRTGQDELDTQLLFRWPAIRTKLASLYLPSKEMAICFLRTRALPLIVAEPTAQRFATHKFIDYCFVVSQRIAKFAPAAAVAFARLLLNGIPRRDKVPENRTLSTTSTTSTTTTSSSTATRALPRASCTSSTTSSTTASSRMTRSCLRCCWCEDFHSGHHVMAGLARGCFRQPLRDLKPFAFLVGAPPDIWFQLILKSARNDDTVAVRQLAKLCTVLVEAHLAALPPPFYCIGN